MMESLSTTRMASTSEKLSNIIKETIKERYRLLPYWYTVFEEHCRTLEPILRPVWYHLEQVSDAEIMHEQERFMLGEGILVVPILEAKKSTIKNCTKGLEGRWYDYYTKKEVFGDEEINVGLERVGVFVKGGEIIPSFDIRSYVKSSKDARESNINLYVALDEQGTAKGKLYVDDGESFNYQKGEYVRKTFEFKENTLTWNGVEEGSGYTFNNRVTRIAIAGLESKVKDAYIVQGDKKNKVQVVKADDHIVVEFVALANKNWKIVLE